MAEPNLYQLRANVVAWVCYIVAAVVLLIGVLFTLGAALTDLSQTPFKMGTNAQYAALTASMFTIFALIIALCGRRVKSIFGQPHRQEKLAAKSAVGCLNLGSLGCGLWSLLSAAMVLVSGTTFLNGEPAGWKEIFMGSIGYVLFIALMLVIARFITVYIVRPHLESRGAYKAYLERIQPLLVSMANPETRDFVQARTMEVLPKLDATHKSILLTYLSRSGLLKGPTRIVLRDADFSCVDLRSADLPGADLSGINLEQASLQGARLYGANLSGAKLNRANLSRANLQNANLQGADLTDTVMDRTKQ